MKRPKNYFMAAAASFALIATVSSQPVRAENKDSKIEVTITDLTNISGNGALEACGTAVHRDGIRPLLVTLRHDASFYTALVAGNDKWCILFKRWNFSGKVEVGASPLSQPGLPEFKTVRLATQ